MADQQKKPENKLAENILPIAAVVVLILALVFAKGAVFAIRPLMKFAIPGGIAYFSWRWLKRKFVAIAGQTLRQKMEDAMRGGPAPGARGPGPGTTGQAGQGQAGHGQAGQGQAGQHQVIDLCPKCGSYLKPGHRCEAKRS